MLMYHGTLGMFYFRFCIFSLYSQNNEASSRLERPQNLVRVAHSVQLSIVEQCGGIRIFQLLEPVGNPYARHRCALCHHENDHGRARQSQGTHSPQMVHFLSQKDEWYSRCNSYLSRAFARRTIQPSDPPCRGRWSARHRGEPSAAARRRLRLRRAASGRRSTCSSVGPQTQPCRRPPAPAAPSRYARQRRLRRRSPAPCSRWRSPPCPLRRRHR